jgi:hypothetical protein
LRGTKRSKRRWFFDYTLLLARDPFGRGNAAGVSMQSSDIAGKRLEILCEVIPGLRRLAILGNFGAGDGRDSVALS